MKITNDRVVEVVSLINKKVSEYDHSVSDRTEIESDIAKIESEITSKIKHKNGLSNVIEASKLVLEKLVQESKENVENFLTYSLKQIFVDKDYSVVLNLKEETKRAGLEFTLVENGVEQEVSDAVGGGIISAIGLLLQIYYLEVYELNKIMFIDEGLKEISTGNTVNGDFNVNYLENMIKYLKRLTTEHGYKFVIVTHDNNVRTLADRVYEVKGGEVLLCL